MKNKQLNLKLKGFESLKETIQAIQMVAAPDVKELFILNDNIECTSAISSKVERNYGIHILICKRYYSKKSLVPKIMFTKPKITAAMPLPDAKKYLSTAKCLSKTAGENRSEINLCNWHLSNAKYEYSKALNPLSDAQISYVNYIGDIMAWYKSTGQLVPFELLLHLSHIYQLQRNGPLERVPWFVKEYLVRRLGNLDICTNWLQTSKCSNLFWSGNAQKTSSEIVHNIKMISESCKVNNMQYYAGKEFSSVVDLCITNTPFSYSDYDVISKKSVLKPYNFTENSNIKLFQFKNHSTSKLSNIEDKSLSCITKMQRYSDSYDVTLVSRAIHLDSADSVTYTDWASSRTINKIIPIVSNNDKTIEENLNLCDWIERNCYIGVIYRNHKSKELSFKKGIEYEPCNLRVDLGSYWDPYQYLTELKNGSNVSMSIWDYLDTILDILESVTWKLF